MISKIETIDMNEHATIPISYIEKPPVESVFESDFELAPVLLNNNNGSIAFNTYIIYTKL